MPEALIIGILAFVMVCFVSIFGKLKALETRMKSLKFTLDQVADQVEVPEHPINEKLREMLRDGKDVQAVKVARLTLGLSLLEAKQYVDDL